MRISDTSSTEFALTPTTDEGDETDILRWERVYCSVEEFLDTTKRQSLPMPVVSVVNSATGCLCQ